MIAWARPAIPLARAVVLILTSFLLVGIVYQASGFAAADVLAGVWQGSVTATGSLDATLRWATPMLLIALGVLISLRAGFFNVGAQGQFYFGATGALAVAMLIPDGPPVIVVPLGFLAGAAAGAACALVPGYLRVRFGTDEVITTLMTNFLGALWLLYVTATLFQDASGSGETKASRVINKGYRISDSAGISPAIVIICVVAVVTTWLLVTRTRYGVTSGLVGRNPVMARWQGIDVRGVGLTAFALSGAFAGIAGAVELFGPAGRLVSGFAPDIGFTAILVAVVGNLNVWGVLAAALFFGGLQASLLYLPIVAPIPRAALDVLRGTVALLVTVSAFPLAAWWRHRRAGRT
jgi:general nucleoside transport system permease protein